MDNYDPTSLTIRNNINLPLTKGVKILQRPTNRSKSEIVNKKSSLNMKQVHLNACPQIKMNNTIWDEIVVLEDMGSEDENVNTIQVTNNLIDIHETPMNHPTE